MTNQQTWDTAVAAAAEIVSRARSRAQVDMLAIDASSGASSASSNFMRAGTSGMSKTFPTMPSYMSDIIRQGVQGSSPTAEMTTAAQSLLSGLLQQDRTSMPLPQVTEEITNMSPTDYTGDVSLANIAGRDPYGTGYEQNTQALYDRVLKQGLALSQTGPTNVRGGAARQGYAMADINQQMGASRFKDINENQRQEANVVTQAAQVANAIEQSRRGTRLGAQQQMMQQNAQKTGESLGAAGAMQGMQKINSGNLLLASDLLGKPTQTQTDNMFGMGNQVQNTSQIGGGITCCFIFLEALNGTLPWYVRMGRDEHNTPNRRAGYVWMSTWLVPMMQKSTKIRSLVNTMMIKPFLALGRLHYVERKRWTAMWLLLNVPCRAWFAVWSTLGMLKGTK